MLYRADCEAKELNLRVLMLLYFESDTGGTMSGGFSEAEVNTVRRMSCSIFQTRMIECTSPVVTAENTLVVPVVKVKGSLYLSSE